MEEAIKAGEAAVAFFESKAVARKVAVANAEAVLARDDKALDLIKQVRDWVCDCARLVSWEPVDSLMRVCVRVRIRLAFRCSQSSDASASVAATQPDPPQAIAAVRGPALRALRMLPSAPRATLPTLRAALLLLGRAPASVRTWREVGAQLGLRVFEEVVAFDARAGVDAALWTRCELRKNSRARAHWLEATSTMHLCTR